MYQAINNNVIVKVRNNTDLEIQCLEGEVIATTKDTEKLMGKTIIAERRLFIEIEDAEEETITSSGFILGDKTSYASIDIKDIVAVKE